MPEFSVADNRGPEKTCLQCGYRWTARLPDPRVCPNPKCHSTRWNDDLGKYVGIRNEYVILEVSAREDDAIWLSLKLRNAGHSPNIRLEGPLLRSLQARARNLGVRLVDLVGFIIQFDKKPEGGYQITNLTRPRVA
jgi:hypothetical protein